MKTVRQPRKVSKQRTWLLLQYKRDKEPDGYLKSSSHCWQKQEIGIYHWADSAKHPKSSQERIMAQTYLASLLFFCFTVSFSISEAHPLDISSNYNSSNNTRNTTACLCKKRPLDDLETAFKLANQPGCIHLEKIEANKVPCTKKLQDNSTTLSTTTANELNPSVSFHVISWNTHCLSNLKMSSECFRQRKLSLCTWSDEIRRVNPESGKREVFPPFELHVRCSGCNATGCLETHGSCYYRENPVRYLPLVRSGLCAEDGFEEWVVGEEFRLVNAACSCIRHHTWQGVMPTILISINFAT